MSDNQSLSDVWSKVRGFFAPTRDQVREIEKERFPGAYPQNYVYANRGKYFDQYSQYTQITHDLQSRYIDYENMDDYPEVASALDTYADEATTRDIWKNHRLWVEGDNDQIVNDLSFMLHKQLEVDGFQWELVRYLCKYGSNYERMFVNGNGVVATEPLPVALTRRVHDSYGSLAGFIVSRGGDFNLAPRQFQELLKHKQSTNRWQTFYSHVNSVQTFAFEDWEVAHFRLVGKDRLDEYGFSVTDPARWVFRRLVMMEDSALVHRLTRAPSRYVFYVDTGNLPPEQAIHHVQRIKDWYARQRFVSPSTGKLDMSYNPLAVDEDFFIPVHRERGESVRVDSLQGPDYQCVTGDTVVPLLDGTDVPIRDLVDRDKFWVYSINDDGEVVPGLGHSARRTKKAEVWEIELDSGEIVRCSDNHPFMLRDGSWKRADELEPDDSLLALILADEGHDRWSDFAKEHIPGWKNNHKVVAVRRTGEQEWLYDITVDETHNFAIGQGVIVHNSVDDVDYFRKKLGRAIKIPNFGLDNDAQARPLTQEDIRLAAAVMRVQQANIEGWKKVCFVHLVATGRSPFDSEWSLHMSPPSAILELARMEVLSSKADVMSRLQEHVSVRWLLTKLFGFSEDEAVNLMVLRQEEIDMVAVAEIEREKQREKTFAESDGMASQSRAASLGVKGRAEAKLLSKAKRGGLGVSLQEYDKGRSDLSPEKFLLELKSRDKNLFNRLSDLNEKLHVLNKKMDVSNARSYYR